MTDNADDLVREALSQARPRRDIVGPTEARTVDSRPIPVGTGQTAGGYEYEFDADGNITSIERVDTTGTVGSIFTWDYYARRKEQHDD